MYENLPHLPGVGKDLAAAINWFGEPKNKQVEEYLKQLDAKIGEFREAAALVGKAKDIEKLHAQAEELKATVLSEIGQREAALEAEKQAFTDGLQNQRDKVNEECERERRKTDAQRQEANRLRAQAEANAAETGRLLEEARKARAEADKARENIKALEAELQAKRDAANAVQKAVA